MSNKMSLMPNISIPRSRFKQDFNHSFDMFHGDVVPVDCFEVVPGDEFSYECASLIRMSTPVVPIMGNIKAYYHAFFVPLRLIFDQAEQFYGDPSNHDTVSSITPVSPNSVYIPNALGFVNNSVPFKYSVQDYLGKEDVDRIQTMLGSSDWASYRSKVNVSPMKERAYLTIWNDHFRPSLMVPPVLVDKSMYPLHYGSASFLGSGTTYFDYPFKCLPGFKQYDYFTASTFSPQFASATVSLPLGLTAPLKVGSSLTSLGGNMKFNTGNVVGSLVVAMDGTVSRTTASSTSSIGNITMTNLVADLAAATAANINDIRFAFQLQKYYERSNYGSKYFEILNAHYGITNPDSRLQRAERLGSHEFYINISQVVSTSDTDNGTNGKPLGNTGAVSTTGDKVHLFTKSFSEPGYVMVVLTTKYDRQYSSGWLREDLKKQRFEFYSPEFAHLGDQATRKVELQSYGSSSNRDISGETFGYQEHWAEYRYRKNLVSGTLRVGESFDIWTLADSFNGDDLTLGYDFLKEDRDSLARLLMTGTLGPDYIVDYHANIIATRELPLYSIPGLIDHFGAL